MQQNDSNLPKKGGQTFIDVSNLRGAPNNMTSAQACALRARVGVWVASLSLERLLVVVAVLRQADFDVPDLAL